MTKKTLILAGFCILKFLLQYTLISPGYDLQRDEYLHLDQAHHLAWGYLSIPPFTSWISYIIYLLGNSVFWVKFFPALFGVLTLLMVWKATGELGGNLFAAILSATCILFSALLRLNTLYQPNSFDVLSWTAFYCILIRYVKTNNANWLFAGAVVFAVGFLNKYNIVFMLIGLFPALLLFRQREVFLKRKFYLALGMVTAIVLPNLLWQYSNNFPVLHHLSELSETQLVNVNRADFLKSQVLFYIGSVVVILSALYALVFYKPFRPYRFFAWSILFTLVAFMYFKAKDYYAIGIYPVYIAFGSVFLEDILQTGWKRYLQPVALAIPLLLFIPFYQVGFPNKSPEAILRNQDAYRKLGLLRWEDGKDHALPQDFADMVGWKELANEADRVFAGLPNPDRTLILCDNYGQAGAINYYTKHKGLTAHSFNADYANWLPLEMPITDVVLVKENDDPDKERKTEAPLFDTVYLAGRRINKYAREDTVSIYVLRGAKADINKRIREEAEATLRAAP